MFQLLLAAFVSLGKISKYLLTTFGVITIARLLADILFLSSSRLTSWRNCNSCVIIMLSYRPCLQSP